MAGQIMTFRALIRLMGFAWILAGIFAGCDEGKVGAPVAGISAATTTVHAKSNWTGKKVVFKEDETPFRVPDADGKFVERGKINLAVVKVRGLRENMLLIRWHGENGYIGKDEVIPLDEAEAFYSARIKDNPRDHYAFFRRGTAHQELGNYQTALKDHNEAIRLNAANAPYYNNRAYCLSYLNEFEKALADYAKAARLDPKFAMAHYGQGYACNMLNKNDEAIPHYDEAIRLDARYVEAFINRGTSWSREGEYEKAQKDFSEALRLDPEEPLAHDRRAWLMATCPSAKFRNGFQALSSATQACQLTEWREGNFIQTLAAAYAELGEFEEAVKWQSKMKGTSSQLQKEMEARLKMYQNGQPYREEAGK
jgi:Tfp pilus assembly protein PilF